jgi:hypothetical protein
MTVLMSLRKADMVLYDLSFWIENRSRWKTESIEAKSPRVERESRSGPIAAYHYSG